MADRYDIVAIRTIKFFAESCIDQDPCHTSVLQRQCDQACPHLLNTASFLHLASPRRCDRRENGNHPAIFRSIPFPLPRK